MRTKKAILAFALLTGVIGSCAGDGGQEELGPVIVATTTILGDVASNLVGDDGRVETIMPIGADPHDFEASAQQAALIRQADLVVANGLGLEEGLIDLIESAEDEGANVLELAPLLDPLPFAGDHGHDEDDDEAAELEEDHGDDDPHFWQDPVRMAEAVRLIAQRLAELQLANPAPDWSQRAELYAAEIMEAHAANESVLATVPIERRKLVTNHEAFGYFADRYRFEVIAVVVPGGSTLAAPSAGELADLVEEMKHEGTRAIFAENTNPTALAEAVAAELDEQVTVVQLYTDSLGEAGSAASTYIGLITENARLVAEALS